MRVDPSLLRNASWPRRAWRSALGNVGKFGTLVLLAGIGSWGIAPAVAGAAASGTPSGQAALIYTPTGLTIGGTPVLAAGSYVCSTDPGVNQGNGNLPVCGATTVGTGLDALAAITLLQEQRNDSADGESTAAHSQVANIALAPGQVPAANCGPSGQATNCDLLDATVLSADTSAACDTTTGNVTYSASSTIATLTIAGNPVITPGSNPGPNTVISVGDQATEANTIASVVLDYARLPGGAEPALSFIPTPAPDDAAQAASAVVNLPQQGVLSNAGIAGTLYVSYAASDFEGCPAPQASPSPTPAGSPTPTASPTASPSPTPTASPSPSPSASPCPGTDSDDSQEDQHESAQAQAHESCNDEAQEECHEAAQAEVHEQDSGAHDGTATCPETSGGAQPAGLVLTPRNDIGIVAFALLLLAALGWRPRIKISWKR